MKRRAPSHRPHASNRKTTTLEFRLRFEELLTELSARFVNLPDSRVDREIQKAQKLLCRFLNLDRCSLWQMAADDPATLTLTHFYQAPGGPSIPARPDARSLFPWCLRKIQRGELIVVPTLSTLPPKAQRDRETWRTYKTKSCVAFPLSAGGGPVFGAFSFDSMRHERKWDASLVKRLQLIADVLANALARKHAQQQARQSAEQWRVTFDAIQDPVMILDPTCRILQANAATRAF